MAKLHKISEVAEMLGLSTETIRSYENMGVIKPTRDEKNGYRYYSGWDLHMLARARLYRKYGFSLEEAARLLGSSDSSVVAGELEQKEEQLEQEIIRKINLLQRMRQEQKNIDEIKSWVGKYRIEKNPAIYRLHMQDEYTAVNEKGLREKVKEWTDDAPFLFSTALFRLKDIQSGKKTFSFGFGVDEEYASYLDITNSPYVEYIPSRLCVYTVVPSRSGIHLDTDLLFDTFNWMKKNNLEVQGDIVTRVVLMLRPGDEYYNWHQVWIPVSQ